MKKLNTVWQQWLRHALRQWRMAESRLLFLALLISVTAVSSVTFFTDRTDQAMQQQASQILGGDLVVQSSRPLAEEYSQYAVSLGLRSAQMTSFPSMVLVNDKSQLVQVKAVSSNYPLFGQLHVADHLPTSEDKQANTQGNKRAINTLATAQAWAEPHLFIALGIKPNTTVQLGASHLTLTGLITQSPDQGGSAFEFMPKLLMPLEDLAATGLVTPASRARFSLLVAGETKQIQQFHHWLKPRLQTAEKIRSIADGLPSVQQALQRGQQFLSLASLLSVILAGVAIALTSYSLSQRETHTVAILKTLGASRKTIIWRYTLQLFSLATFAALLGIMLGYMIQDGIAYLLRDFIRQLLPAPSITPVFSGFITAWVMVLGFSLPQLLRLINISPIQIFQRQSKSVSLSKQLLLPFFALALGMLVLIMLQIKQFFLSLVLLIGLLVIMGCFWLVAVLLLRLLHTLNQHANKRLFRLPKANVRIALLIMVFGAGFFSLLLLTALRTDLIDRWQATLPDHAPNYFLINIQPHEIDPFNAYLQQYKLHTQAPAYPMIRGRLKAINGKKIIIKDVKNRRAQGLLKREANISTAITLPQDNQITAGTWFNAEATTGLSIEEGIAKAFKLQLGDTLTFDIAGEAFTQKISSFRRVRWDTMQPNFFILAAPKALQDKPHTFMTSIHLTEQQRHLIPELIKKYPSVSAIDISHVLNKIKELINKAAFAVQAIFLFTLLSGIAVLFAALQSQQAERRKELAILKSMGARHSYLRRTIITEFVMIGGIAGFLAALFAMLVSNLLAYRLFELAPTLNPYLLLIGITSGAALVGIGGYLNLRPLFKLSPSVLFQE